MKKKKFDEMENMLEDLEVQVMEITEGIEKARDCYYNENWLSDEMYKQIFLEKIKEIKKAIDEAIEANVL